MHTRCHKSAVDRWVYVMLVAVAILLLATLAPVIAAGSVLGIAVVGVSAAMAIGLPIWLIGSTDYTIADGQLHIRSGPFRWQVAIDDIQDIKPTRSPLSSPALSLNRLDIRYGRGRSILVSPEDPDQFVNDLNTPT